MVVDNEIEERFFQLVECRLKLHLEHLVTFDKSFDLLMPLLPVVVPASLVEGVQLRNKLKVCNLHFTRLVHAGLMGLALFKCFYINRALCQNDFFSWHLVLKI